MNEEKKNRFHIITDVSNLNGCDLAGMRNDQQKAIDDAKKYARRRKCVHWVWDQVTAQIVFVADPELLGG